MALAKAKAANPDSHEIPIYVIISNRYMIHEPTSTARARRLCERRAKGVVMVAPVEVGEGGVASEKI